jgi:Flp pilus assembly protein TadG
MPRRTALPRSAAPAARRSGATVVEMAFVLPVFTIFMAGFMEINHAFMVMQTLRSAAEQGARYGVADGVTTDEVTAKVLQILAPAIDTSAVTLYVKDASEFDKGGATGSGINYATLPDIEVATAAPRQLYVVRAEVDYSAVSLLPPFFVKGAGGPARLFGQSVVRHE